MHMKISKVKVDASRREFLKGGGALVVSFTLAPGLGQAASQPTLRQGKSVALDEVAGFLSVDAKGDITVYSGKVDLGTGVYTALTQIAAEELHVPMNRIHLVQGDTLLTPDQGPTFGSLSIQIGGMRIRQAAATAREALLAEASSRLGVAKEQLLIADGIVTPKAGGKGVTYASLVGGKNFSMKVDDKAPLKDPKEYTIVGKSVPRMDIPDKVSGRFTYMQDFKLKGMLHARVVRPTGMKASLQGFNDFECRKQVPGFVGCVRKGNFLAVVAKSEWGAVKASRLVDASWSDWHGLPDKAKLWEYVRSVKINKSEELQKIGNSAEALAGAAKQISATYDFAIHTHGSIGPSCAVAEIKDGKITVWTASQQTHLLRKQLANMLQAKPEDVRCIYVEGSGCYGRNGHEDAAADAVLLARELGKPVRVQWSRADEHGWDPKGPPTLLDYKGGIDAGGNPVGWESGVYIPDRPKDIAVTLVAADLAGLPKEDPHPGNIHQALAIPYGIPNVKATAHWLSETPFKPSWIRTPGRMQNTYGNESFLDELAALAGVDPLEYRIKLLKDPRGLELLDRLKKLSGWTARVPRPRQDGDIVIGRGISYIKYELVRTYVGAVADVEVNKKTGKISVKKFHIAHDCGQIINPDGLRNQIEGNVVQTVSRVLIEDLQFNRSTVTSVDWKTYPILTFPDVPEVAIDLIDRPNEKPWGAGEPTAAIVPSAIANAFFDATGVRLRSVPFSQEKVLAGLKAATV
jgi:nicotinate dehydrogenase subunit B